MKYLVLFLILLTSCSEQSDKSDLDLEPLKKGFKETYAKIAFAAYDDALLTSKNLQNEIDEFLKEPSAEGLEKCRTSWLRSREAYLLTEAFRFSNGPIDNKDGVEGAINAWPLDESYIDYVRGNPKSGIINNPEGFPEISKKTILSLNEQGGETNISTGFHAIEFLLWGQDQEDTSLKTPGNRNFKDYSDPTPNADRRAAYLKAVTDLLVEHLESVQKEWESNIPGNYREKFLASESNQSLKDILKGLFNFSKAELAGERLFVALTNKDQEDEHSCFSDNTHRDIIQDFKGIKNLVEGKFINLKGENISGTGLLELIRNADSEEAKELENSLKEIAGMVNEIPVPFDHAITEEVPGQGKLSQIVNKLMALGDIFAQSIKILKLEQREVQ